jgi:enoyl-[acyl-carrier protein] reductase III
MNDLFSLSGKRILVTGGTRGIGRAISLRFARAGAEVIANYVRDFESAQILKDQAESEKLHLELCRGDLTSAKGMERVSESLGPLERALDALVHCAATGVHKPLDELTARHLDWTFSLNVKSFFELVKLVLPRLRAGSSIIAVSSKGARRAVPCYSMIGSSKGALEALARNLAVELAPRGVRVNILCPGSVLTDAWKAMPDSQERLEEARRRSPIGRLVTAEEVAWAAQFLCSKGSGAVVGHCLVVDGGVGIVE